MSGQGYICHRNLVGTYKLVAHNQTRNRAVGNSYEEVFGGYCREAQHAASRIGDCHTIEIEWGVVLRQSLDIAQHAWRLAQKNVEINLGDGIFTQELIGQCELAVACHFADHGIQTAFALGECAEVIYILAPYD